MFYKKIKAKPEDLFKNKLEIAKISKDIFGSNAGMILYPLLGAILSIALFVLLIMVTKGSGAVVLALIFWYLLLNIIIAFFNTASISCARVSLNGKKAKFSMGIKEAFKKTNLIINWGIFSSTKGLFANMLSDLKMSKSFGYSGEIEWPLVKYFTLPIMVLENKDIKNSVDESQKFIKRNWGRNPDGEYKISFFSMAPFLFVLSVLILSSVLKDEFVTYGLFVVNIFVLIISFLVNHNLRSIFFTVMYMNNKSKAKK